MALGGNQDGKTASGTIAIASNGAVTGSSTTFTTQARVGDYIVVAGEHYQIVSIASNTSAQTRAGIAGATLTAVTSGTSYALTHGLNTIDVIVMIKDNTTLEEVITDVVITDAATVTVSFAVAPAANAYRVIIKK